MATKQQGSTGNRYMIGVDTGGTYTDAAVIVAGTSEVVASASKSFA